MKLSSPSALIGAALISINLASAQATTVQPRAVCEYEDGAHCTGWYPNENTCQDIFNKPGVTDYQLRACLAWSGHGSRG
ncbi:hypothetical protein [Corynebacterium epidermidicanis]|uniref:Uncharacterized protein n=1 Tax=Corynebacterium epidermidicanis TaxID=1050174 RepID=A0A0G3GS00_9CORY|nr:hypothetical protein [Corynebacterium epidermidicanis]AKK03971.1 hypothetical protein CEPID_10710 [Corynebacterium epidermidicanis]